MDELAKLLREAYYRAHFNYQDKPGFRLTEWEEIHESDRQRWRDAAAMFEEAWAASKADAWDRGYACGLGDYGKADDETKAANPYRGS